MSDQLLTLRTIFSVTHDEATNQILEGVKGKIWEDVSLPRWLWKAAAGKVAGALDGILALPLGDILCAGWNTHRKYEKYTDSKRYPAGNEYEEDEGPFSIDSEHTPHVQLMVNGVEKGDVKFPITLKLDFSGARLVIGNGRFQALKPGTCTASGKLCCETAVLKELKSSPLVLPGIIRFGDGVPIREWGS